MELRPGYKRSDVGVIPDDWDAKPLGSVLSKGRLGGNYANQDAEAELPLMKMGNLARGNFDLSKVQFIRPGVFPEPAHRLVYGDVLFNTRNTLDLVGKVAIWRDEIPVAYYNSNLMRLEFDPDHVCSNEYANYSLNTESAISRLRGLATGTTSVAAIYTRDLLRLQLLVPPLPEQRAIAEALSDVDALLASLDQVIAKKRDLKQAAMQQLLTGQTRLPGFHGEWEVERLGDVAEMGSGGTPPSAVPAYYDGDIPWASISDMTKGGKVISSTDRNLTRAGFTNSAAQMFPAGTILYAMYASLGECSIAGVSLSSSQAILGIRPKNKLSGEYLYYYLTSLKGVVKTLGQQATQANLNKGMVQDFRLSLPPLPEQTAIASVLSDMDAELAALEARLAKTRDLKQAMMQELLTGRIRLVVTAVSTSKALK
jgi:type I restriction enzyme S subunit